MFRPDGLLFPLTRLTPPPRKFPVVVDYVLSFLLDLEGRSDDPEEWEIQVLLHKRWRCLRFRSERKEGVPHRTSRVKKGGNDLRPLVSDTWDGPTSGWRT